MASHILLRLNPSHVSCIDRLATELYNICTDNFHNVKNNWRDDLRQDITNIELYEVYGFKETGIFKLPYHSEYNLETVLSVDKPSNTERRIKMSILSNKIPLPSSQKSSFAPTIMSYVLTTYTDYSLNNNFSVSKYNMSLKFRPSCLRLKLNGQRAKVACPAHLDAIVNLDIDQTIFTTFSPQDNGLLNVPEDYLFGGQESMTKPIRENLLNSRVSLKDLGPRGRDSGIESRESNQQSSFDRDRFGRNNEKHMDEAKDYLRTMRNLGVEAGSLLKRRDSLSALSARLKANKVPSSKDATELAAATDTLANIIDTWMIEEARENGPSVNNDGENISHLYEKKVEEISQFVLGESEPLMNDKSLPDPHDRRQSPFNDLRTLCPATNSVNRVESGLGTSSPSLVWDRSQDTFIFNDPASGSRDTFSLECDYPSFINPEYVSDPGMPYKSNKIRQEILAPVRHEQHHRQPEEHHRPRGGVTRPGYSSVDHRHTRGERPESPRGAHPRLRTPPRGPPQYVGRGRGHAGPEQPKFARQHPVYPADEDFWPEDSRGTSPALKLSLIHI